ncbi:MAG: NIPSNAP family protein [Hyphomicrobiales bacterium]
MTVVVERTFVIERGAGAEFKRISREEIWPYMEARGCKILGLFAHMHGGASNELVLLTAYDSMAHWESTRATEPPPAELGEEMQKLWTRMANGVRERHKLTAVTHTRVMRPVTDWVEYPVRPG